MPVNHVHSESDLQTLIKGGDSSAARGFVVDFSAEWCGPCKAIAPAFEAMSNKYGHANFLFIHVDVDECADLAQAQGIRAMPTFVFYKNSLSTELTRIQGADPTALESKVKEYASQFQAHFTGSGNKLGGTGGSRPDVTASGNCNLPAEEIIQIAQASVEYSLASCCRVGFRFQPTVTGGVLATSKPFVRINGTDPISKLRLFVDTLLELGGVSTKSYELHTAYPPQKLDETKTINESSVAGAVVVVKFI